VYVVVSANIDIPQLLQEIGVPKYMLEHQIRGRDSAYNPPPPSVVSMNAKMMFIFCFIFCYNPVIISVLFHARNFKKHNILCILQKIPSRYIPITHISSLCLFKRTEVTVFITLINQERSYFLIPVFQDMNFIFADSKVVINMACSTPEVH
jgi:hypothetical protein